MYEYLLMLNNNKFFWGITMLFLNLGSRYIIADLGKVHEYFLTHEVVKKIIIFCMCFVATRDIVTSFILCILYVIIVDGVMHEKRKFSFFSKKSETYNNSISVQEYNKAKDIVMKFEKENNDVNSGLSSSEIGPTAYDTYVSNIIQLRR
jgi:type IV secretory pathway VirB3-like protein